MEKFQTIVLAVSGIAFTAGIIFFAASGGQPSGGGPTGNVSMWGTMNSEVVQLLVEEFNSRNENLELSYEEKNPENFDQELVNALAAGRGPDIFLLSSDMVLRHADKVQPLGYDQFTQREFRNTFIHGAEVFQGSEGTIAFPFMVDPLVMYYNRNILSSAGVVDPPSHWSELFDFAEQVTTFDDAGNIVVSAVPLGEFANINHAKDILSAMFLQLNNSIVETDGGNFVATIEDDGESVLSLFSEFSDSSKDFYSWNRSLPNSKEMFVSGRSALYFGHASELSEINESNPNLNFDVAKLPQTQDARESNNKTFGRYYSLAVSRQSDSMDPAFWAAFSIAIEDIEFGRFLSASLGLPSTRRDVLSEPIEDGVDELYFSVFADSALIAETWLDPDPQNTNQIFQNMINDFIAGRGTAQDVVTQAASELNVLLQGTAERF